MKKEDTKQLNAMIRLLEEFRKEDRDMPLQTALTFLLVAKNEIEKEKGLTTGDAAKLLDMSPSSASRNLLYLSDWKAKLRPDQDKGRGAGLVFVGKDMAQDARISVATLQPSGKSLVDRLVIIMRGAE